MGFFALVLALLIERLKPLRPGNRLRTTIGRLARSVRVRLDAGRSRDGALGWVLVMALALLVVLVAESLAAGLHPVFVFALHVFVLYCTIGFRQFSEAFTEIRIAFAADDAAGAGRILAGWVRDSDAGEAPVSLDRAGVPAETCRRSVAHALLIAHRQVLGPLFCYIVIPGAAGPLLYRVAETLARHWRREEEAPEPVVAAAAVGTAAADEIDPDEADADEREADEREADASEREVDAYERDAYEHRAYERHASRLDLDPDEPVERDAFDEAVEVVDPLERVGPAEGVDAAEAVEAPEARERAEPLAPADATVETLDAVESPGPGEPFEGIGHRDRSAVSRWGAFAVKAFEAIDWLPVRLSAGGFAVVGNFEEALYCWRAAIAAGIRDARTLLLAAGGGALGLRLVDADVGARFETVPGSEAPGGEASGGDAPGFEAPGGEARPASLQAAAGLVWRSLLMWIGLYALITVSAWMGS